MMAVSEKRVAATIAIIEDDPSMLELESYHLQKAGYRVLEFSSTMHVEEALEEIDLLIVDRKLPGVEGSDFVRYLRQKGVDTPVIFVSSKQRDEEIEEGFVSGGDDYLRKPFNIQEFVFRVDAMIRRTSHTKAKAGGNIEYRDIVIDIDARKLYIEHREVTLTKLEFDLLLFMVQNRQKVLDRELLLRHVWRGDQSVQKRTINVTLNRLKKKIDPTGEKVYFVPIHGIGYKLL